MAITLNGSGTITGVSSLATALVNPVVTTTMGVGNATPAASGAGITFPAAQSASSNVNTLDDYEEGTWTPTVSGSTTAGAGTYTSQVGRYTKVGNRFIFSCYVVWTAHTGTGNLQLTNLPFASVNQTNVQPVFSIIADSLTFTNTLCVVMAPNQVFAYIASFSSGAANASIAMDTAAGLYISGQYEV